MIYRESANFASSVKSVICANVWWKDVLLWKRETTPSAYVEAADDQVSSENIGRFAVPLFLSRFPDKYSYFYKGWAFLIVTACQKNSCDRFLETRTVVHNNMADRQFGTFCWQPIGTRFDMLTYFRESLPNRYESVESNKSFCEIMSHFASKHCRLTSIGERWLEWLNDWWMKMNFESYQWRFAAKYTRRSGPQ